SYTVGHIRALSPPADSWRQEISDLALRCLTAKRLIFRRVETDPHFVPIPAWDTASLQLGLAAERNRLRSLVDEAVEAATGIDRIVGTIGSEQTHSIHGARPEDIGRVGQFTQVEPADFAASLISFAVGVVFGRWDIRLALDEAL